MYLNSKPQDSSTNFFKKSISRLHCFTRLMVVFSLMCLYTIPAAARDERPDLNSFSDAQRLEMCQLLNEWINYELYYTFHHLGFGEVHGNNAFLSWHREQLQDLELFLTRKGKIRKLWRLKLAYPRQPLIMNFTFKTMAQEYL